MYIIENDYTSTTPIEFLEHEGIKLARRDTSKGIKWYFLEDDENNRSRKVKRKDLVRKWNGKTYFTLTALNIALKLNQDILDLKRKPRFIL